MLYCTCSLILIYIPDLSSISHIISQTQTQNKHMFYLNLLQPSLYVFILMWLSIMFWNRAALILLWHHASPSVHRCVILTAVHPAKRWVSQLPKHYLWHDTHAYQTSRSPEVPATLSYCMQNNCLLLQNVPETSQRYTKLYQHLVQE